MDSMRISLCHHLSISYMGGGEKWIIQAAKELARRGHTVEIYALPFLLEGKRKVNPKELLDGIPYVEGRRHKVKADIVYVTYSPLSWMFFQTSKPRIGGIHAYSYWQKPDLRYGFLPNVALLTNKFLNYCELRHFNAIHMITKAFPCNHPKVYWIPNFVDSEKYRPMGAKDSEFTVAFISRKVWQKGWDLFQNAAQGFRTKVSGGQVKEDDMPSFISSSHVSLIPSRVDTFGLSIVESLMCETPVITTALKTHDVLDLPLAYGETAADFRNLLGIVARMWEKEPAKYHELAMYGHKKAMYYEKNFVMDAFERMLKEVAAC